MATPGLFLDAADPRPSPLKWTLGLAALALLLALGYTVLQIARLRRELEGERRRSEGLLAALSRPTPSPPRDEPPRPAAPEAPKVEPEAVAAPPAPDVRVLPPAPLPEAARERLAAGLAEFRAGRYERAELHFFRAVPDSYLYLMISSLLRGDTREALAFLSRAAAADPAWFRKVRPRELFGSAAEFERLMAGLEARVREDPLDPEAKMLLAYLHYHEKGAPYAKALLAEVTTADPLNAEARRFLENVDR